MTFQNFLVLIKSFFYLDVGNGKMAILDINENWRLLNLSCTSNITHSSLGALDGDYNASKCEQGLRSGILENVGDKYTILFSHQGDGIQRKALPEGVPSWVWRAGCNHGICSLTAQPWNQRWFYHIESDCNHSELLFSCSANFSTGTSTPCTH